MISQELLSQTGSHSCSTGGLIPTWKPQHINAAPPRPLHGSPLASFPTRKHTLLLAPMEAGLGNPLEWPCCRSAGQ